ncbi:preprotein translocase subunit YajC [uncultured Agrococcus sp.]|uniref:preprotein translocase subunit YajC n=1 Tax=uncultured Agrococcus sp. TaxID=382258 RepID=UPI0025DF7DA0|nr:preprotein translocase subunit YajC [uncultured Agrococcus sp.]
MHVLTHIAQQAEQGEQTGWFDPLTLGMLALLAVMIFFMFRSSRKRKQQQQDLQTKMVPGVRVMTTSGIFGTLLWIDEEKTQAGIEIAPGVEIVVHRQILSQVVEEEEPSVDSESDYNDDSSRED